MIHGIMRKSNMTKHIFMSKTKAKKNNKKLLQICQDLLPPKENAGHNFSVRHNIAGSSGHPYSDATVEADRPQRLTGNTEPSELNTENPCHEMASKHSSAMFKVTWDYFFHRSLFFFICSWKECPIFNTHTGKLLRYQ